MDQISGTDMNAQGLGENFLKDLEQAKQWQEDSMEDCRRLQRDFINAIHQGSRNFLERGTATARFATERETTLKEKLLESLHFSKIIDRYDRIVEAYGKTFQWIYCDHHLRNRSWANFVE